MSHTHSLHVALLNPVDMNGQACRCGVYNDNFWGTSGPATCPIIFFLNLQTKRCNLTSCEPKKSGDFGNFGEYKGYGHISPAGSGLLLSILLWQMLV